MASQARWSPGCNSGWAGRSQRTRDLIDSGGRVSVVVVVVGGVAGESRGHKRLLIRLPYREKLIAFASFISSPSISQL